MPPSLIQLAQTLDALVSQGAALVTENESEVVAGDLTAANATALVGIGRDLGLGMSAEDRVGNPATLDDLDPDFERFRLVIRKPAMLPRVSSMLTNVGLDDWLSRDPASPVVWVARLPRAFETYAVRFAPWGDPQEFTATPISADPIKVVRDSSSQPQVPRSLGQWILKERPDFPWDDVSAQVWINRSATALLLSMVNEVESSGTLMFRGPPVVRYRQTTRIVDEIGQQAFKALQDAARWIFENDREIETRHGLFTAELARTNVGSDSAAALLKAGTAAALEGARIAYQLGLNKLSLDSLKAMADLRKAVADETAKLAETTRQLAGAVATTLFAGIGVIATKLTVQFANPIIGKSLVGLGFVLCLYVLSVILSSWQFVRIQRNLRVVWRDKLYRFLPHAEYETMVVKPATSAERGLMMVTVIGVLLTAALFAGIVLIVDTSAKPAAVAPTLSSPAPSTPATAQRSSSSPSSATSPTPPQLRAPPVGGNLGNAQSPAKDGAPARPPAAPKPQSKSPPP